MISGRFRCWTAALYLKRIHFPLIVDHLLLGELGLRRHLLWCLLFSVVVFLLWWIGPSTVALNGNMHFVPHSNFSSQSFFEQVVLTQISLFHSQLKSIHRKYTFWTLSLNSMYYYYIPLFSVLFAVTATPTNAVLFLQCCSLTKINHISAVSCTINVPPLDLAA